MDIYQQNINLAKLVEEIDLKLFENLILKYQ